MYQPDRVILIDLIGNESMITNLNIIHYRKLKNLSLAFKPGINLISGTNGTCKSSILHIIGNAFQRFKRTSDGVDYSSLSVINAINKYTNPKVENLTKGDKTYNDPAKGTEGELFNIQLDNETYAFRRHNSQDELEDGEFKNRFRLILKYSRGEKQSLPFGMVIYLGLSRIVPVGELEDYTEEIKKNLPEKYQDELISLYQKMTDISITEPCIENSNEIKHRISFKSEIDGIDSDTISAGEDNIMIILTALVSLKYHFESCSNEEYKESYLLIDEFDATLHPSLQFKLLTKIKEYSEKYNIQVFSTTHSLYLLESAFKKDLNVIYLKKGVNNSITIMSKPDIYQIRMHLNNETLQSLYENRKIPIFTEDNEARIFSEYIFNYFSQQDSNFARVMSRFHFSTMTAGADNLKSMFYDKELTSTTLKAICFLDGDKNIKDLTHRIISLPGKDNPEQVVFKHLKYLLENDEGNRFWDNETISRHGFTPDWVKEHVLPTLNLLIRENFDESMHTKPLRELQKAFFNGGNQSTTKEDIKQLFQFVMKDWVIQNWGSSAFVQFRKDLQIMFNQVAVFHHINPEDWTMAKH